MRVLIYTDHPSTSHHVYSALETFNPWPGADIALVSKQFAGFYRFDFPEVGMASLPFVGDVALKSGRFHMPNKRPVVMAGHVAADGRWTEGGNWIGDGRDRNLPTDQLDWSLERLVDQADLIVDMSSLGDGSAYTFETLITKGTLQRIPAIDCKVRYANLTALGDGDWYRDAAISGHACSLRLLAEDGCLERPEERTVDLNYDKARRFFDFNWSINASALLHQVIARSGLDPYSGPNRDVDDRVPASHFLSKNVLLGVLHVAHHGTVDSDNFKSLMEQWQGSGKYAPDPDVSLGGYRMRSTIYERLHGLGFASENKPERRYEPAAAALSLRGSKWQAFLDSVLTWGQKTNPEFDLLNALISAGVYRIASDEDQNPSAAWVALDKVEVDDPVLSHAFASAERQILAYRNPAENGPYVYETLGLATRNPILLTITREGRRFADLLPKSAYDPDLPFRLHQWCQDWPTSRPKMEAYMRRYFGAIKRSNAMANRSLDCDLDIPGMPADELAKAAQVSVEVVESVRQGEGVSERHATRLRLAVNRLTSKLDAQVVSSKP